MKTFENGLVCWTKCYRSLLWKVRPNLRFTMVFSNRTVVVCCEPLVVPRHINSELPWHSEYFLSPVSSSYLESSDPMNYVFCWCPQTNPAIPASHCLPLSVFSDEQRLHCGRICRSDDRRSLLGQVRIWLYSYLATFSLFFLSFTLITFKVTITISIWQRTISIEAPW